MTVLLVCSIPLKADYFTKGYVENIKDNYIVVNNGLYRVIVYTADEIDYGSIVELNDFIKPINSYNNFELTDFSSYCLANNILGQVDSKNMHIEKKIFSLKNYLYKRNMKNNNYWANRLLFSRTLNIESENLYLITQSGMQLTFLFSSIRKKLNRFFYKRKSLAITFVLSIIFFLFKGIDFVSIRIMTALLLELTVDDRRKRLALEIIILCFLKPYYVLTLSFLIPEGLKIIHLFSNRKLKIFDFLYIAFLQLLFNHHCYILQLLTFPIIRFIGSVLYALALIVFIPLNLNDVIINYINLFDKLSFIKFNGRLFEVLFLLIIFCFYKYIITGYKKYVYLVLISLTLNNYSSFFTPYYTVTYLDVGQGDSCLITTPFNNEGLLIDTGGNRYKDIAKDLIIPYLESLNVKKVDVIVTHMDYDHCGGLTSLLKNYEINNVYYDKQYEIDFCNLKIYNPLWQKTYDNDNDNSQISYFHINQFAFLFLADIGYKVEYDLVNEYGNLDVDIVKLSHHGSKTATSDKMLATYKINTALISAGRANRYGHPHEEVIDRLKNFHVNILSTQENHAVKFYIFNHLMLCVSADMQFRIYLK